MNNYVCHSGGCPGADMAWELAGREYNVHTIAYSFHNHKQDGANPKILSHAELHEGYAAAQRADKTLKRYFDNIQYPYIKNLLARNWFQIKNSEAVFAIGWMKKQPNIVDGGTGWAVQMAIDSDKPVYVYVQNDSSMLVGRTGQWVRWMVNHFEPIDYVPKLTKNFAGIGSRDLTDDGMQAILDVYKNTFEYAA